MQASALSVAATADDPSQDVDLVVSVRDSAHMAMPDVSVDLFSSTNPGDAFGADGSCSNDDVQLEGNGAGKCEITDSDETTNSDGDLEIAGGDVSFGASATVWAWTGDVGAKFDADETVSTSVEITVTKPATKLRITDDMAVNAAAAKFGDRVTFVIQVVDDDGNPVATEDVSVNVSADTWVDSGASGVGPEKSGASGSHKTDDSGRIELSYRQADPRTSGNNHGGDEAWLDLDIEYTGTALMLEDKTTLKMAGIEAGTSKGDAAVVWLDTAAVASKLTLAQAVSFHEASRSGSGASNTVTATLVDQYGDPVSSRQNGNQKVRFSSDDANGIGAGEDKALVYDPMTSGGARMFTGTGNLTRTTNRRGVANLPYNRDSADSGIETILAEVRVGTETVKANPIYHYWANEVDKGESASGRLLATDTDNNQLVILGGGEVSLIKYDSNDQFTSTMGAATLSAFETDLENAKRASAEKYENASKGVSQIKSFGERWSKALDTEAGTNYAVDHGVFVVGDPSAMCDHDTDPDTAMVACGAVHVYAKTVPAGSPDGTAASYGAPVTLMSPSLATDAAGEFGTDVDIGGGGLVIVVGAPGAGTTGKVYIFTKRLEATEMGRSNSGWGDGVPLTVAAGVPVERLGIAVAVSRDLLGEFHSAAAVAEYGTGSGQKGVVKWAHTATTDLDTTPWVTKTASGNALADPIEGVSGADTVAVAINSGGHIFIGVSAAEGTPASGDANANVGKIHVFEDNSGTAYEVEIAATGNAEGRKLGASVATTGDNTAAAVGAPGDNAVYVLTTSDAWVAAGNVTVVKVSDSSAGHLGSSVSFNDDGDTIAASGGDIAAAERGEVFTFASDDTWATAVASGTNLGVGSSPNTMFTYMVAFDSEDDALHAAAPIQTFTDIYTVSTTS